jgi:hypothetical protein
MTAMDEKTVLSRNAEKLMEEAWHFVAGDGGYADYSEEAQATLVLAYVQAFAIFANRRHYE